MANHSATTPIKLVNGVPVVIDIWGTVFIYHRNSDGTSEYISPPHPLTDYMNYSAPVWVAKVTDTYH